MKTASIFFLLALCQIAVAQIIVTPDVFEFGVVKEHQRPVGTATLTNTGRTTVTVTKLMRTCVCSDAKIDKQEIKPGESANAQSASGRLVPPPCGSGQNSLGRRLPDPCVSAPALMFLAICVCDPSMHVAAASCMPLPFCGIIIAEIFK